MVGAPIVLGCAWLGCTAGALVDVLASGFDGPTVFPTLLHPGYQGALMGGALGVVAVRRALRALTRLPAAAAREIELEHAALPPESSVGLVVMVLVLVACVTWAVADL